MNSQCNPNLRPWRPGQSGNPAGKPRGSVNARARALRVLDEILDQPAAQEALREALSRYILKDPVRAFRTIIMPLLPKEARLEVDSEPRRIVWQSLCERDREEAPPN